MYVNSCSMSGCDACATFTFYNNLDHVTDEVGRGHPKHFGYFRSTVS